MGCSINLLKWFHSNITFKFSIPLILGSCYLRVTVVKLVSKTSNPDWYTSSQVELLSLETGENMFCIFVSCIVIFIACRH